MWKLMKLNVQLLSLQVTENSIWFRMSEKEECFDLWTKRKSWTSRQWERQGKQLSLQEQLESWSQVRLEPSPLVLRFGFFPHIDFILPHCKPAFFRGQSGCPSLPPELYYLCYWRNTVSQVVFSLKCKDPGIGSHHTHSADHTTDTLGFKMGVQCLF